MRLNGWLNYKSAFTPLDHIRTYFFHCDENKNLTHNVRFELENNVNN